MKKIEMVELIESLREDVNSLRLESAMRKKTERMVKAEAEETKRIFEEVRGVSLPALYGTVWGEVSLSLNEAEALHDYGNEAEMYRLIGETMGRFSNFPMAEAVARAYIKGLQR